MHSAASVKNWLAARGIQMLEQPPYSPDLAPANFFLFPKLKKELAGHHLSKYDSKTVWEGVSRTVAAEDFATAFRRWYERCQKCADIGGGYFEKS